MPDVTPVTAAELLQTNFEWFVRDGHPRSIRSDSDTLCAYRGANGTRCAIGCRIPDELYEKTMDFPEDNGDAAIEALLTKYPAMNKLFGQIPGRLLWDLQQAHDTYRPASHGNNFPEYYLKELVSLARSYHVDWSPPND